MIKQNDPRLRREIQGYGCNFLSHLAMVRMDWLPEELEAVYQEALAKRYISVNCSVDKPQELLAMVGSKLKQIGSKNLTPDGEIAPDKKGKPDFWGIADEEHPRVQWSISVYSQRNTKEHKHYTLANRNGEIYDPYDGTLANYPLRKQCVQRVMLYG